MHEQLTTARDQRLLASANRQFGVLRYSDLIGAGLGRGAIESRLLSGRLTRLHRGVYSLGHSCLLQEGRWLAAVWACGEDAVLSHVSGAAFHGCYAEAPDDPVHVTTTRAARSRSGIVVHRATRLERKDVFHPHPLRVTTIPRTLVDIADVLPWPEFRTAADSLPQLHLARIRQAQERAPGRRGAPLVTRLLDASDAHTKSEFERRFLRFLTGHSLARPDDLNVKVAGHKADCVYYQARLVIELDGRAFHRRRDQMRADNQRNRDYQLAGYRILRLVWDDLHPDEARSTVETIVQMLGIGELFRA